MNIDNRIELIMKKMDRLKEKSPKFACGKFPPEWKPPLSEQVVETYEKQNGIKLPEDYRRFVTTVAECGTQPFYGLYSLKSSFAEDGPAVHEKFPFTVRKPLNVSELSAEEYQASVYKGYKRDKIEMRGDRAEMSDFPLYLNTAAGGLDCRNQVFSFSCGCFRKL